jgi:hypothetical protein
MSEIVGHAPADVYRQAVHNVGVSHPSYWPTTLLVLVVASFVLFVTAVVVWHEVNQPTCAQRGMAEWECIDP